MQRKGSFKISFVAQRCMFSTRFRKPIDCGDHTLGCIAEMAKDDRKIKCMTCLGALDVPRGSAHKAKEFVGFRTLFGHLLVQGKIA